MERRGTTLLPGPLTRPDSLGRDNGRGTSPITITPLVGGFTGAIYPWRDEQGEFDLG
jgi:hypothetical protein